MTIWQRRVTFRLLWNFHLKSWKNRWRKHLGWFFWKIIYFRDKNWRGHRWKWETTDLLKMLKRKSIFKESWTLSVITGLIDHFGLSVFGFFRGWHVFFFFHSRSFSLQRLATSDAYVSSLPSHHQQLLTSYRSHLEDVRTCVEHNYEIIKLITADVATLFENVKHDAGQVCFS